MNKNNNKKLNPAGQPDYSDLAGLKKYLFWAFGIAWILQIIAAVFYNRGNVLIYQILLAVTMFAPLAAVLLSKIPLRSMGWKPKLKGKVRYVLAAWFLPAVLGAAGAVLYYLIIPSAFDPSGSYIVNILGETGLEQLEQQGISVSGYVLISIVMSVTSGPVINMFAAIGEEAGWRGYMYPILKKRFGNQKGQLLGGMIWGAWHWPIMILAGYEYGKQYWGAPITGMVMFCIFATAAGIFLDWVYDKTQCIWIPALGHGAINAFAGVPLLFLNESYIDLLLVGPSMIGCIGGLPLILFALYLLLKSKKSLKA